MSERMRAVDAAWFHMDEPANLMVVTSVIWLDEVPDWDAVRDLIQGRVVERYPRFRQRVVDHRIGRPRWEDDPLFDVALHVHRARLPEPGDRATLEAFVGDVMGRDLDRRRPLWQAWLVEGYGPGAAIVVRIHHCVADGIALARVLLSLTDAPGAAAPAVAAAPPRRATPVRWLGDVVRTGAGMARAAAHDILLSRDAPTAFRDAQSARKVVAWADEIDLAALKEAAHAHGVTVNDALMAALSGALGRYLDDVGTPAEVVRAMVPVNLRDPHEPLPLTLGNRFGLVYCPLPVGIPQLDDRLAAVKTAMDQIKAAPEALTGLVLLDTLGISHAAVEKIGIDFFAAKASMVVTNVPGPRRVVTLAGVPVAGVLSWAPQAGPIGTSVTIVSYAGAIRVGFATDRAQVPDPHALADAFAKEVAELLASTPHPVA